MSPRRWLKRPTKMVFWAVHLAVGVLVSGTCLAQDLAPEFSKATAERVQAFAIAYHGHKVWGEQRAPDGRCLVDHKAEEITLAFSANGRVACRLEGVPQGYQVLVRVLVPKPWVEDYGVTVTMGKVPEGKVLIRGSWSALKEIAGLANLAITPPLPDYAWVEAKLGPFESDDFSVTIALPEGGISWSTTFQVKHLYQANLGLFLGVGPGKMTYEVQNGFINSASDAPEPDYYAVLQVYPLSWRRREKRRVNGRYFADGLVRPQDRLSLLGGVSLSSPSQSAFLGVGVELRPGFSITAGWQPRKEQQLQQSFSLQDAITGSGAPVDTVWDFSNWAVGLTVDAVAAKRMISRFN